MPGFLNVTISLIVCRGLIHCVSAPLIENTCSSLSVLEILNVTVPRLIFAGEKEIFPTTWSWPSGWPATVAFTTRWPTPDAAAAACSGTRSAAARTGAATASRRLFTTTSHHLHGAGRPGVPSRRCAHAEVAAVRQRRLVDPAPLERDGARRNLVRLDRVPGDAVDRKLVRMGGAVPHHHVDRAALECLRRERDHEVRPDRRLDDERARRAGRQSGSRRGKHEESCHEACRDEPEHNRAPMRSHRLECSRLFFRRGSSPPLREGCHLRHETPAWPPLSVGAGGRGRGRYLQALGVTAQGEDVEVEVGRISLHVCRHD